MILYYISNLNNFIYANIQMTPDPPEHQLNSPQHVFYNH